MSINCGPAHNTTDPGTKNRHFLHQIHPRPPNPFPLN
jgi:hypothetical protein